MSPTNDPQSDGDISLTSGEESCESDSVLQSSCWERNWNYHQQSKAKFFLKVHF